MTLLFYSIELIVKTNGNFMTTENQRVYLYSAQADERFGHIIMTMKDGTTRKMTAQYDANSDWKNGYGWKDKLITHTGTADDILSFSPSDKKRILQNIENARRDEEERLRYDAPFRFSK